MTKDWFVISDNQGFILRVNQQFLDFFEMQESEIVGKPFLVTLFTLIHGQPIFGNVVDGEAETKQQFKTIIRRKNGDYKCYQWASYRDIETKLLYSTARDITGSYYADTKNQQIKDMVLENAIIAITDIKGKINLVNDNFCHMTGYSRDEVNGKDHRIINSGFHSKEFFKQMWQDLLSGKTWRGVIKNRRKDGTYYFVQSYISPLRNIASQIDGFFAVRFDITQAIKDNFNLNEAQRIAKIGSWHFDLINQTTIWSDQLFDLFGFPVSEFPPKLDDQIILLEEQFRESFVNLIYESIKKQKSFVTRVKLKASSGKDGKWLEFRGEVEVGKSKRVESIRGTCQDITDIIKAQESLTYEKQKANQAAKLASLGEMSVGVAHEINNPLAVISSGISLIKRYKDSPAEYENVIRNMKKSIERISKIVSGLKKFARYEEKRVFKDNRISDLIKESEIIINAKLKKHFVKLIVDIKDDYSLRCDDVGMEQVLVNLISNGIDAAKDFEDKWVKIECFEDEGLPVIRVFDSGKGIPEAIKVKLFQPFYTTKPSGEGTGLGLSIIKGILEEHSATVEILEGLENTCFEIKFSKKVQSVKAA